MQRFPGSQLSSVQCLVWTKAGAAPRLFAAGLHGKVFEVSFPTFTPKSSRDSHGGAVWSMALSPNEDMLAIGCEDGFIRIFDVTHGSLEFSKSLSGSNGTPPGRIGLA